jgi:hypothetical protein
MATTLFISILEFKRLALGQHLDFVTEFARFRVSAHLDLFLVLTATATHGT